MGSNSKIQGYNFYPMLLFYRKFSNSVTAYVAVVTATTLLLKLDARVYDWAFRGISLESRALLSSQLFWLLGCKLSLILPKHLYGMTS